MSRSPEALRPPVTVVICAYSERRLALLRAGMAAVLEQLSARDELVVVIDHNPQLLEQLSGSPASVAAPPQNHPRLIANANQRGLSGARNTGVSAARGEIIAFLDDDAVPRPGWLAQLTEPFTDPGLIGTGGVALPSWQTQPPGWLPEEFLWVVGCSYRGLPERPTEIRNPIGANMAFRRDALERAGGFTDGIGRVGRTPLGCEETEFSIRATRVTGGRIMQEPAAAVDHLVTSDRLSARYFFQRCWAEGISKAVVSRLAGSDAALSSERTYTTRTLPEGVLRGLRDGLSGKPAGFTRAAAIIAGLAVTTAGYIRGSLSQPKSPPSKQPPAQPEFMPLGTGQLDLAAPSLPEIFVGTDGQPFERTRLLIRVSGTPAGFLEVETPDGRTDLAGSVELAQAQLAEAAKHADAEIAWRSGGNRSVSIVLCTHDRHEGVRRTIESLREIEHTELEIIVVDNAPSDETTHAVVKELQTADPRIRYVLETQRGLSYARNCGLREAGGDYIAFTDDDVRVDPLWVKGLLRGFDRRPDVACVTGLVASSSLARPAEQYFDRRVWWSSSCEQRLYTRERGSGDSPLHPYTAGIFGTGANFAAKTSALRSLGGFDQCLGAGSPTRGGEDLDIFVRLITAGHALSYEPSALVWHDHRVDDATLRAQMYAYGLGLTAYLTKYALAASSRQALVRGAISGFFHATTLMRRSRAASAQAALEPSGLTGVELRGMLAGPAAYLRARRTQDREHLRAVRPRPPANAG